MAGPASRAGSYHECLFFFNLPRALSIFPFRLESRGSFGGEISAFSMVGWIWQVMLRLIPETFFATATSARMLFDWRTAERDFMIVCMNTATYYHVPYVPLLSLFLATR